MKWAGKGVPTALTLSLTVLLVLLTKNAEIAADGIKKGLVVVENMLLPTLFPLLVASELFISSGILGGAPLLPRPFRKILGVSDRGSVSLCLGLLLGVPVGALLATADLEAGRIEKGEHCRIVCLTAAPSMGFLVGVVGGGVFGSPTLGWMLYGSAVLAALTVSICWHIFDKKTPTNTKTTQDVVRKTGFAEVFTASVKKSMWAFLQIAAFVLTFSALTAYLSVLTATCHLPRFLTVLSGGLLELTAGIMQAEGLSSPVHALLLMAFFAGFAGLSILLQVLSVTGKHAPRLCLLLGIKLAVGGLTLLFLKILLLLTQKAVSFAANTAQTSAVLTGNALPVSRCLFLALLLYLFFHRVLTRPLVYFQGNRYAIPKEK